MKKYTSKDILFLCSTVSFLGISYWLCRYFFFDLHGMKEWPNLLAIVALVILLAAFFTKKFRLSVMVSLGYPAGFSIGLLLHRGSVDPGGGATDNLWIIWAVGLLIWILAGIVMEMLTAQKQKSGKT